MRSQLEIRCIQEFNKSFPGFHAYEIPVGRTFKLEIRHDNTTKTHLNSIDPRKRSYMVQWFIDKGYSRHAASNIYLG